MAALIAWLMLRCFVSIGFTTAGMFREGELGYGDTCVLHRVLSLRATGTIYPDLAQPPHLPANYSPFVYLLYTPSVGLSPADPYLGPKVTALAVFLLTIAVLAGICRRLAPARHTGWWTVLLALSLLRMSTEQWPLQIRGDFAGILCGLLALFFLMAESNSGLIAAAICAGLALQFKILFVAPLIAGTLWLLIERNRRWYLYPVAAITTTGLLYALWELREPRMASQMLSMSPGIKDVSGSLAQLVHALSEPVVALALPAVPWAIGRNQARWRLLLIFLPISFLFSTLTDIQAGGGINYFLEGLLATVPLAVAGCMRLLHWSRSSAGFAAGLILLIAVHGIASDLRDTWGEWRYNQATLSPNGIVQSNHRYRRLQAIFRGRHVFSTSAPLIIQDPQMIADPWLEDYLQRLGKFNPEPLVQSFRNEEFEAVALNPAQIEFRGIRHVGTQLANAIDADYRPWCSMPELIVYLPDRRPTDEDLKNALGSLGCAPGEAVPLAAAVAAGQH